MIVLVYGTRPEAIKLGPVAAELRALGIRPFVLCTGQHTDLLRGTPAETDLTPQLSLGLPSAGQVPRWLAKAEKAFDTAFADLDPDTTMVVVQGDTMSALAGAKAAARRGLLLAHVEAGVRSHAEDPWPEEETRVEIATLADWHLAPTSTAYVNLVAEGVRPDRIAVTGNSGVSALARYSDAVPGKPLSHLVLTMHRREFLQHPEAGRTLAALCTAVEATPQFTCFWPVHPAARHLVPPTLPVNLKVTPPMTYYSFTTLLCSATGVLTDSGGLVEDAATLGVPSACLRKVTDRPEAVDAGVCRRYDPTPKGVVEAWGALTTGQLPRRPSDCFGTPESAAQIARHLSKWLGGD